MEFAGSSVIENLHSNVWIASTEWNQKREGRDIVLGTAKKI